LDANLASHCWMNHSPTHNHQRNSRITHKSLTMPSPAMKFVCCAIILFCFVQALASGSQQRQRTQLADVEDTVDSLPRSEARRVTDSQWLPSNHILDDNLYRGLDQQTVPTTGSTLKPALWASRPFCQQGQPTPRPPNQPTLQVYLRLHPVHIAIHDPIVLEQ
jgi:hypothetical protein